MNSTIREKEKEIIDLKKNLEEKTSEISTLKNGSPALKHQIESAAQREAELDQRITLLGMLFLNLFAKSFYGVWFYGLAYEFKFRV